LGGRFPKISKQKISIQKKVSALAMFEIIGVYKVIPTAESIIRAVTFHKYDWLLDNTGEFVDEVYWEDFENLCLIELQVSGEFKPNLLLAISQRRSTDVAGSEQVPYLEYYLDSLGKNLLSEQEAIFTDKRRVCFFLHFTDINLPLRVGETLIELPSISELPERLIQFTNYVPPD
jgi:hypothetical protein